MGNAFWDDLFRALLWHGPWRGDGCLVVRVGEIGAKCIAFEKCGRVEISSKEFERFRLERGDTVLARAIGSKNHLGKASLFTSHTEPIVIDSHVMRLRPNTEKCDPVWFYSLLASEKGKLILQEAGGATAVQFNINAKQASKLRTPLPPRHLQMEFVKQLGRIEAQRTAMTDSFKELEENFNSLMQRAFKGELAE